MKTANELRIGNWIIEPGQDENKPFQIFSIYHEAGNNKINGLPITYFKSIPLTEDWLVKFGFKHTEDYFQKKSIGKNNTLEFAILHKRTILFDNKKKLFVELKFCEYVHQAQNLYFALTGTELTLKN